MTYPSPHRPAAPFRGARVLLLVQMSLFTLAWVVPVVFIMVVPALTGDGLEAEDGIGPVIMSVALGAVPLMMSLAAFVVAAGGWTRPRFFLVGAIVYESGVLLVLAWAVAAGAGVWVGGWPTAGDPYQALSVYGLFALAVLGAVLVGAARWTRTPGR